MKKFLLLLPLFLFVTQAQAAIVNVALDAPAFANASLYGNDLVAKLTDGRRGPQIHADVAPPTGLAYWVDLGVPRALTEIKIYPRQDNCCADRFSNVRVSVHDDDGLDNIGPEVWHADLYPTGNPGSSPGTVVSVVGSQGAGTFSGRWVKLTVLTDPVPDYALQVTELEVYGEGTANIALGAPITASAPLYANNSPTTWVNGDRGDVAHGDAAFVPTDPGETSFHYDINLEAPTVLTMIKLIARQDGCCPERLSNYRVAVHSDNAGTIGPEVWGVDMRTDGSNPGSGVGAKDVVTADLDPGGVFSGQWIRITSLDVVVPAYALQLAEIEAYGTPTGGALLRVVTQAQSGNGVLGRPFTFNYNVVVVGGDPTKLTFQWKKNGVDIPGATTNSYVTPPVTTADETNLFQCVASYPGVPSKPSNVVGLDINYAVGSAAYANGPLWGPGGWNISLIVDGNHDGAGGFSGVHGDTAPPAGFAYWFDMHTTVNISNVIVWARQQLPVCCPERLANYRLSVHEDDNGSLGPEVWGANLHTDGSNTGSGPGARDVITPDMDPGGVAVGRWVRIMSLEDPVQNYALQLTEIEVFGSVPPEIKIIITEQPATNVVAAAFRTALFRTTVNLLNGDLPKLQFQWQRNGVDIPGATATTYTTPPLCEDDGGAKFRCVISYPGVPNVTTDEGVLEIDHNYARGSVAANNQPLWGPGGWNISAIVDGNRGNVIHGEQFPTPGFAYTVNMGSPVDIERIDIYPRQDTCCPERLANIRVAVHQDDGAGSIGDEVWGVSLYTDGSNPGVGPGVFFSVTADQDPAGTFSGQWIKLTAIADPVQQYALQLTELEVIGKVRAICSKLAPDGKLVLSWDQGTLQSSSTLGGAWTDVAGATSPLTISFTGQQQFYRLRVP